MYKRYLKLRASPTRFNPQLSMTQELKFALRSLTKSPGFFLVCVLTVALGIGSATAIYSVANAVVFRPLPFRDEDRLAWIWIPAVAR